jgi:hypothetical protein
MRRIGLIGLALTAICAFGGLTASASMANFCVRVEEPGTGNFTNAGCTSAGAGNYIEIQSFGRRLPQEGQWCAEVEKPGTGNRTDANCEVPGAGNFVKVYERPDWFAGGNQLKQGVRQMKLQVKGIPILSAEFGEAKVVVDCNRSVSEGTTIEGQGNFQGQGKGRLTFTSCKVAKPEKECTVAEPITTVQTKAHLASFGGQSKIALLFEPTEGKTYVTLKFSGKGCGVVAGSQPVTGTVAAEAIPTNVEGQEGLLNFPEQAIKTVFLEGQERKLALLLGGNPTVFSAAYGARLETGETFGAFGLY